MKSVLISTITGLLLMVSACSTLENSYDSAMRQYDSVAAKVSDVKGLKSDIRYVKERAKRVAGR